MIFLVAVELDKFGRVDQLDLFLRVGQSSCGSDITSLTTWTRPITHIPKSISCSLQSQLEKAIQV